MGFSEELVTRLRESGISGIEVYAGSFPAPKNTSPNYVCVIDVTETEDIGNREIEEHTKRFIVTGTAEEAMAKAREVVDFFIPKSTTKPGWMVSTSFLTPSYSVMATFRDRAPAFFQNRGNIFFVEFTLRFKFAG